VSIVAGILAWFRNPLTWFIAVLVWMRTIWFLSSIPGDENPQLKMQIDKVAHFLAFAGGGILVAGLFATIVVVILRRKVRWDFLIPATAIAIGLLGWLDEWHQCFTPGRSGANMADWIADFLGGIAGALVFRRIFPRLAQMAGMNQNGEAAKTRAGD
jgi:VanZ family protein